MCGVADPPHFDQFSTQLKACIDSYGEAIPDPASWPKWNTSVLSSAPSSDRMRPMRPCDRQHAAGAKRAVVQQVSGETIG
jgi:hypothetical protein